MGMEMYPSRTSFLEFIQEPLLAGVVGGVCFLFVAIILSLATACIMNHRGERPRRRRRDDLPTALQKSPLPEAGSPADSPDSVLKLKLCPPLSFFPGSSASQSVRSSFDKGSRSEYQDQRQQLLSSSSPPPRYTLFESQFGGLPPPALALESISRGADGRFIVQPYEEGSTHGHSKKSLKKDYPQCTVGRSGSGSSRMSNHGSARSDSPCSEKDEQKDRPVVVSVDVPGHKHSQRSPGRVKALARNLSRQGCFYSDDEQGYSEGLLDHVSFYSDSSERRVQDSLTKYHASSCQDTPLHTLRNQARNVEWGHDRRRSSPSRCLPTGTMRSTTEWKRESNSLSKCLKLAQEREEMEKELEQYTSRQSAGEKLKEEAEEKEIEAEEEAVWKPQGIILRPKSERNGRQANRLSDYRKGYYFENTSSPMAAISNSSSYIHWDVSPVNSVTGLMPAKSPAEKVPQSSQCSTSPQRSTALESTVNSGCLQSPSTQCTCLSLLSPDSGSSAIFPGDIKDTKTRCPERRLQVEVDSLCEGLLPEESSTEMISKTGTNERLSNSDGGNLQSCPVPACDEQQMNLRHGSSIFDTEKDTKKSFSPYLHHSNSTLLNTGERTESTNSEREKSHSESSTLPYDLRKAAERAGGKSGQSNASDKPSVSPLSLESEKEGVRTCSRKSDKCLFSDSPSCVSPLTLTETETDQSSFSVTRMSDSYKSTLELLPSDTSLHQTSAILEYLSLPGFIEMSVDGPAEEIGTLMSSEQRSGNLSQEEDVDPVHWEIHKSDSNISQQCTVVSENRFPEVADEHSQECRRFSIQEPEDSRLKDGIPHKSPKQLSSLGEQTERVYCKETQELQTEMSVTVEAQQANKSHSPDSSSTLVSTAKEGADCKIPASFSNREEPPSARTQRGETQGCSNSQMASRIHQAPIHFMKKSLSMGPSRLSYSVSQPCPQLKKSISLGSQRWEHNEIPQNYSYERYQDEFLHPDVRVKSVSLGHNTTPSFSSRQGQFHPAVLPVQPQSHPDLKSSTPLKMSSASLSQPAITPLAKKPRQQQYALASARQHCLDPRRHATAFPEASRWPVTYQDTLRSVQQRTAIHEYSGHHMPPRIGARREYLRPPDSKLGSHRAFLPRGYSWPSPYISPFIVREPEGYLGKGGELDIREYKEGRSSYASQSSGRGSMGPPYSQAPLRQSPSLTPTLPSSPETTEETKRYNFVADVPRSRPAKRGNTSVDESYEWDEVDMRADSDALWAASRTPIAGGQGSFRGEQRRDQLPPAIEFRELQSKGQFSRSCPPVSGPSRGLYGPSLSEARFNALRLEYQEYRRLQESSRRRDPHLIPNPDSDPAPSTALL